MGYRILSIISGLWSMSITSLLICNIPKFNAIEILKIYVFSNQENSRRCLWLSHWYPIFYFSVKLLSIKQKQWVFSFIPFEWLSLELAKYSMTMSNNPFGRW